jgi:peptidoglycan/LPS O-acetylase OafA/YrhL
MSKSKFRKYYIIFAIIAWIALLTPISIWVGINFDDYVVQKSGFSVTTGGILAVLYIVLLLKYGLKRFGKVFWVTLLLVIVYCLDTIIVDALPLTFCAWLGTIAYSIFECPMKYFKGKLNVFVNEEVRVTARKQAENTEETPKKATRNGRL